MKTIDDIVQENDWFICEYIEENNCNIPIFILLDYLEIDLKDIIPIFGYSLDSDYPIDFDHYKPSILSTNCHIPRIPSTVVATNIKNNMIATSRLTADSVTVKEKETLIKSIIQKYKQLYEKIEYQIEPVTKSIRIKFNSNSNLETIKLPNLMLVLDNLLENGLKAICSKGVIYVAEFIVDKPTSYSTDRTNFIDASSWT